MGPDGTKRRAKHPETIGIGSASDAEGIVHGLDDDVLIARLSLFAPLGPELVTVDEIEDPSNLDLRLWLNGELMQDSNTSNMIFHIPETIAALSAVMTLEPGDVIAMGTPEGVGLARGRNLRPGDHLRVQIESLGQLDTYIGEQV